MMVHDTFIIVFHRVWFRDNTNSCFMNGLEATMLIMNVLVENLFSFIWILMY